MRNFRGLYFVGCISFFSKFVAYLCGLVVQRFVQKKRINSASYTHYTQRLNNYVFWRQLYSYFYSPYSHSLHTLIIQPVSVTVQLYTLYTGPTTTTTYNIFKKG